ncbi:MAG: hypothetical protein LBL13_06990 [Bacteroidales bacterium]|jgi:hypothetical protein|nr:hypothetical protein [Bacteroidales bacterium]
MTNKEYISATLTEFGIEAPQIEIILGKGGIVPDDEVDYNQCDTAIYNRMSIVLSKGLKNITEGGWSQSWNTDAVKDYYKMLCKELGLESVLDMKVVDISSRW